MREFMDLAGKVASRLRSQWMGALALFLVLAGGSAYAGQQVAKNSVDSKAIKSGAVKDPEIANNAVDSGEVEDGSLRSSDFAKDQLPRGPQGEQGPKGDTGAACPPGNSACVGPPGAPAVSEFSQFYALMPPDNPATVAPGTAVGFPQDGPSSGDITRAAVDEFVLAEVGTYRVAFNVSVTEAGQLGLRLNGSQLAYTVFGRATGTSEIAGEALVTTTSANSIIEVVNPTGNSTALTITPLAGGTAPAAASLVIERLR